MAITSLIEIVVFLPLVFTVPLPSLNIWYFIIATTILHGFYRYSVVVSYQYGDLSFVSYCKRRVMSYYWTNHSIIYSK